MSKFSNVASIEVIPGQEQKPAVPSQLPDIEPVAFELFQNYPNPFNPETTIQFSLPEEQFVKLTVYNIRGEEVSGLIRERLAAGQYSVTFDGRNLASGIYFYRISTETFAAVKQMLLIK